MLVILMDPELANSPLMDIAEMKAVSKAVLVDKLQVLVMEEWN